MSNLKKVMWAGTVRNLSLAGRLRAAAIAGCDQLSVTPSDYIEWLGQGFTTRDMLLMAGDSGVRLNHLDPLIRWVPDWRPAVTSGKFPYHRLSFDQDDFFRFANALRVASFTAWGAFPVGRYAISQIIDYYGELCRSAAKEGLHCNLEFLPMYGIPDLATAWAVTQAVDMENSGIIFDFWHYFRGCRDDALLRSLPGEKIGAVQICDATATLPENISLLYDGQNLRRAPGEGQFPVKDIIKILTEIGAMNNFGPEIFSCQFDAMSAEEIGIICAKSISCFTFEGPLQKAGGDHMTLN